MNGYAEVRLAEEWLHRGAVTVAVRKSGVDDGGGVECSVKKKTQRREKEERNTKTK